MLLEVKNVRKNFENTEVLKDVSLSVTKGDVVVILGPSGSGKTTFLRCLNFLERADGGTMEFRGAQLSLRDASDREVADVRKKTAFVFQNYNLFANKTALENVTLGLTVGRGIPKGEAHAIAMEALRKVGMAERADYYPAQLSGGQQQRVGIARALINYPVLILADEPTGNLDEQNQKLVMKIFHELHDEGHTILTVTHSAEVGDEAQRCVIIEHGHMRERTA